MLMMSPRIKVQSKSFAQDLLSKIFAKSQNNDVGPGYMTGKRYLKELKNYLSLQANTRRQLHRHAMVAEDREGFQESAERQLQLENYTKK